MLTYVILFESLEKIYSGIQLGSENNDSENSDGKNEKIEIVF